MRTTVWLALLLIICATLRASEQVIVEPTDHEVTLEGVIHQVTGYGPPGFGHFPREDSRIRYWVLDVRRPVNVPCEAPWPCQATKRLRLLLLSSLAHELELKARALEGRHATASGFLYRQTSASDMTSVYMEVASIQPSWSTSRHQPATSK